MTIFRKYDIINKILYAFAERADMDKSTDRLFQMIDSDPEGFLEDIDKIGLSSQKSLFTDYLYKAMSRRNISFRKLSVLTNISLSQIYQLSSGQRGTGRDNAILIALALGLDLKETQQLLRLSYNGMLYPKVRRDAIIICCIECGMTISETNDKLLEKSEKGLIQ